MNPNKIPPDQRAAARAAVLARNAELERLTGQPHELPDFLRDDDEDQPSSKLIANEIFFVGPVVPTRLYKQVSA